MSLTDQLRDSGSPVRSYLDRISPQLAATLGEGREAHAATEVLGLGKLAGSTTTVPRLPNVDGRLVGTAFDFRARIELGGFRPRASVAAAGVDQLPVYASQVENGPHRAKVLADAFAVAESLLAEPATEADLDRASILLAHCEQIARGGPEALGGALGTACDLVPDGQSFADSLDPFTLADIRSLMDASIDQLGRWRELIASGDRFEPNPGFAGSALVGGADADWLVGDVLIDCKVYSRLTVPRLRDFLRQLLGYVMLDLDDSLGIRSVGVWLPRQGLAPTWSLVHLLGGDPEELLPPLREGFVKAAGGQQVAVRIPVPMRRKRELLADNRHTPYEMLSGLACSDDVSLRFRVARNAVTPEATVRMLATDRYARVREGVATNVQAPDDVLDTLARDRSVAVRRAVAANPRAPRPVVKALMSDSNRDVQWSASVNDGVLASRGDALQAAPQTGPEDGLVRIDQDRGDSALGSEWFSKLLSVLLDGPSPWGLPLPQASRLWEMRAERPLDVHGWLKAGLPPEVKADLMRGDRPAWVRQAVAGTLPLSDPAVRDRLLSDPDPDIRWSALCRSLDHPDDALGQLLGELAASRDARLRFRTDGSDEPAWSRPHTPSEYNRQTLGLVAAHPSTPYAALQSLMESTSAGVLSQLIENPSLRPDDAASIIQKMQSSRSVASREMLARSSRLSDATSEKLAADRSPQVRLALATNDAAPAAALSRLSEDRERAVRLAVLQNRGTPADLAAPIAASLLEECVDNELRTVLALTTRRTDIDLPSSLLEEALDRLSKSRVRDPNLRELAAEDERTGPKTLTRLAKSADDDVRCAVGANMRAPAAVLGALATDPVPAVRAAAAGNSAADASALVTLAHDEGPEVRAGAAANPRLPEEVLISLLLDSDHRVRNAAFKNPSTPNQAARQAAAVLRSRASQAQRPTRADFEEMAADKRAEVRVHAAQHPEVPRDVLTFLGGERRSAQVRRAVAAHPNTPPEVLGSLADDEDAEVRQAAAFNSSAPAGLLAELAGRSIDLALLVALNPGAPSEILDALTADAEPLVSFVATEMRRTRTVTGGRSPDEIPALKSLEGCSTRDS